MSTPEQLRQAWEAALAEEKAAWEKVKDKLPGTPRYDEGLWEKWRLAVRKADSARKALIASVDQKP